MAVGAVGALSLEGERYSRAAMWFHWIIAALIIVNLLLGFFRGEFDREARGTVMFLHKSTGFAILALSLARLGWRLTHRPPAFDPVLARWEVALARAAHGLFYVLMIVIPVTGWLVVSRSGKPTSIFGLVDVPALPFARTEGAHELWEGVHGNLGWAIVALIVLHVAGALKHHLQGHRHLVGRMGPWLYRQR
jgi:cytochrome b561